MPWVCVELVRGLISLATSLRALATLGRGNPEMFVDKNKVYNGTYFNSR